MTEPSRRGRSTLDLLGTSRDLEGRRASAIATDGLAFDLGPPCGRPPCGRMTATMAAGIAEFERELIRERARSGMAVAEARGRRFGRRPGRRPPDRLAPEVPAPAAQGRSRRLVGREPGPGTNTVAGIVREGHA